MASRHLTHHQQQNHHHHHHPLDSVNTALTGLTVGTTYYLGTAGGVLAAPLDATDVGNAGKIDQKLGMAKSTTELVTDDYDYVVL